jgi:SAM-dependent methyltransferase
MTGQHRFYGDLAPWWPLISAPEEYAEEAAFAASLLRTTTSTGPGQRSTVLELGSGGGNNAVHLKAEFDLTLVDLSPEMVAVSQRLNPECAHHVGDMRTVRLDSDFDAVFVHDAIEYMTTEDDLRQAVATAYAHCRPGGVAVLVPDDIVENFAAMTECGGHDGPDGRGIRYLSWTTDPDPTDSTSTTEYAFLIRQPDGTVEVAQDTHVLGLFSREHWITVMSDAGFSARSVAEITSEDHRPREFFVGVRPA